MSAEPRHGPVTMHRAVERAMMKALRARAPDAPHPAPGPTAPSGDDASPGAAREAPPGGDRGARPALRRGSSRREGGTR